MDSSILDFLPLALLILIAWVISRGIKRFANKYPPAIPSLVDTSGVGGWLLFLIVGLTFLGPLAGAGRINLDIISTESQFPNLKVVAAWSTYKSAIWWSFLVVCCLSFYAGIGLAKGRDTSMVKRAKILLWVIGPLANLVMGLFIPITVFGKFDSDPNSQGAFIGALVASIIAAAIWTAYLAKSKRVRATYGDNSSLSGT